MRGRLVSKQGQILANALLAGVASGIGHAFTQSSTTLSVSPLGTTSTVDPGKQLEAGLGTGVGKALERTLLSPPPALSAQDLPRLSLVGRNGAGKSTLLKLIAEEILPITEAVRLHVAMPVTQNSAYRGDVSGSFDNVFFPFFTLNLNWHF